MSGGWERLANIELSGNATVMDTANDSSFAGNDFLARDNLFIEIQTVPNTSNSVDLTFNVGGSTTAGVYNYKYQNNEAAQASSTNQSNVALYNTAAQFSRNCGTFYNLAGQEKLGVFDGVFYDAGSDVPDIRQTWVKWATTAGQIQRVIITGDNTGTGFASGSSLTVWGSDEAGDASKTGITNVPLGSRYEETDTRKIYRRKLGVSGSGLKAYWHMDETSGSTFTNDAGDITGNSSIGTAGNLTITGATLNQSGSPSGLGVNADFDGSSDYARAGVGTEANFNFLHDGSDWSVSFWAKMDATGSNQHIIDTKGAVGEDASGLDIRTMTTARWRCVGTKASGYYVTRNTSDNYIPDTTDFHHYVMTWDNSATTVTFYRDGANKETGSGSSGAAGTAEDRLVVGGTSAPSGTINGKVLELAMWNRTLSDAEVTALYNSGDGGVLGSSAIDLWVVRGTA